MYEWQIQWDGNKWACALIDPNENEQIKCRTDSYAKALVFALRYLVPEVKERNAKYLKRKFPGAYH